MVYLTEYIKQRKLLLDNNLGTIAYYHLKDQNQLCTIDLKMFLGLDLIAAKGYLSISLNEEDKSQITKPPYKGVDISSTIYRLLGAYLADPKQLQRKLNEKFEATTLKNQFFISRFVEIYREKFKSILTTINSDEAWVYRVIEGMIIPTENDIKNINSLLLEETDTIDLLVLEALHSKLLQYQLPTTTFNNIPVYDLFLSTLSNFHNAVKKIIQGRRKDHDLFRIQDEYDVQDILYVIFKSIFPTLKEEDPTPKVGGQI